MYACEPARPSIAPSKTSVIASNLLLEAELVRILCELGHAGVRCVVLKGTPLARRLYERIDGRVIGDNDVLVHAADARQACALLERDGYRPLPFLDLERRLRYTNQFLLSKERAGVTLLVEIHWNAFPQSLFRVPEHVQWAHTERFVLRGVALEVFDPPLTLIHLAAHFAQHGFAELRILRELATAFNLWWLEHSALAFSLSDAIGLRPALDFALSAAAAFGWLAHDPPAVVSRRSRALLRLLPIERLTDDPALQSSYVRQLLPLLVADLAVIPRSIAQRLFPPLDELASTYERPISKALYVRYPTYLMRPIQRIFRSERPI